LSVSSKLLLTGFIVLVCAVWLVGLGALYHGCKGADGLSPISISDIRIRLSGADEPVLALAAENPQDYEIVTPPRPGELDKLKEWAREGAPREGLDAVLDLLAGSKLDVRTDVPDEEKTIADRQEEYRRTAALAEVQQPISPAALGGGTAVYLVFIALAFGGLGLMFVQSSLFERTKVLFISGTFGMAAACPICLWLARANPIWVYPLLLFTLLLSVGLAVLALVAVYDLWFREPAT